MKKNNKNKIWRMAFRCGNRGKSLWGLCKKLKVAAITYAPVSRFNLTHYPTGEPKELWTQLSPSQKSSLRHLAYDMKKGDMIYVKEGKTIVGKGIVCGNEKRSYQFDKKFRIISTSGYPWPHQVPVQWENNFIPVDILLGAEHHTVLELNGDRLEKLQQALSDIEIIVNHDLDAIMDEEDIPQKEGGQKSKYINYYERKSKLRVEAIKKHGTICKACKFDFFKTYGEHGKNYIEVHHKKPVNTLKEKTQIDPKKDIDVLCANCHRMIHRKRDAILTIKKLKEIVKENS